MVMALYGEESKEIQGRRADSVFTQRDEAQGVAEQKSLGGQERMMVLGFWVYGAMGQNQDSVSTHCPIEVNQ